MTPVGADSETHLIKPGLIAPRLVCVSHATRAPHGGELATDLLDRVGGLSWYRRQLADPGVLLVFANAPFDLGVACAEDASLVEPVFAAYRDGRVRCVQTHQKLVDVSLGMRKWRRLNGEVTRAEYSLAALAKLYLGEEVAKGEDTWRLRYSELDGVPVEKWPPEARRYAVRDAELALRVHEAQAEAELEVWGGPLPDAAEQQRAHWALHLMSMWGVRADRAQVERFVAHCEEEVDKMHEALKGSGIFKPDGSRTMGEIRRRVVESHERLGLQVPYTDPSSKFPEGQVKTDAETLEETDDPHLLTLAESMTFAKHLGQWGPVCRAAVLRPVCASYNVLVDNGRTSCSSGQGQEGTNFQNPPRKGDVRPCFVPRPGWVYCSTDADTIELRANAQNCLEMLGRSRMAEVLWDQHRGGGPDLHVVLGANVAGVSPDEALALHQEDDVEFANVRQLSKHGNFAFAGGAGAERFVSMAWGFGIDLAGPGDWGPGEWFDRALARSRRLRDVWFETWPEMRDYFRKVGGMMDPERGRGTIRQLMSGRVRGEVNFTAACNSFFSGRVADAMKEVLFRLAWECYVGRLWGSSAASPLRGSRPVLFLHDEPIVEHPEGTAHERAHRQQEIMVEVLSKWMPDIPCTSTAVLSRRWHKGGKPVRVDGRLVPVMPVEEVGADGKRKVKWLPDPGALVEAAA